jgi:hypothetical protein
VPLEGNPDLALAAYRLSEPSSGVVSRPVPPDPPPDEVGALDGFGLRAGDRDIRVSVYLFEHWGGGQEHASALTAVAEASGLRPVVATNGAALLFGVAPEGDVEACLLLNDWCSAFAGHE